MVVPRTYAQAAPRRTRSTEFSEKKPGLRTRSPSGSPQPKSPLSAQLNRTRTPSPTRSEKRTVKLQPQTPPKRSKDIPTRPAPLPVQQENTETPRWRRDSKDLLSSTAIPIRRKPRGRVSQRLPRVDHVAHFSSLLMDDVKPIGGSIPRSVSSSNFEGLFGHMDEVLEEGQMYVGSEGLDSGILSTRSLSDVSLASIPSPDESYLTDDRHSLHSGASLSVPERRSRHVAASEDCSDDHPLSVPMNEDDDILQVPDVAISPPTFRSLPRSSEKKPPRQSLKSSLTASLKAIKSAAQSVSNRATSEAEHYQATRFFDFQPGLTDDRRPPPSFNKPTPEMRRYLNPPPLDSAAQLHFWQDHRHSKFEKPPVPERSRRRSPRGKKVGRSPSPPGTHPRVQSLPPVVQLADCLPPSVRTSNASSPPIWLTSEGTPVNRNTAVPLLFDPNANDGKGEPAGAGRHREPRENRDFLRVFCMEMAMRRSGKLSEDLGSGKARLWLPPVNDNSQPVATRKEGDAILTPAAAAAAGNTGRRRKAARERMHCTSSEEL